MNKRAYYILVIFFFISIDAYLQTSFKRYGLEDGFSDVSIRVITQDNKGFLWFGTFNGLNRYDGSEVKVFNTNDNDPYSIGYNRISNIKEDSLNYLWVTTNDRGLYRYDPYTYRFLNASNYLKKNTIDNFQSHNVYNFSKGTIWSISRNTGIMRILQTAHQEEIKVELLNNSNFIVSNDVRFAKKAANGKMWFGTFGGLVCLASDTADFVTDNFNIYFKNTEFPFVFENNNKLYFATNNKGIIIYDPFIDSLYQWQALDITNPVRGGSFGIKNDVLITTQGQGLVYVDNHGEIHHLDPGNSNLSDTEYFRVYCDRFGKFWIEGHDRGVTLFDPEGFVVKYYGLNPDKREALGEPDDPIFYEDSNGDFWIGLNGGGVCKLNRNKMQFEQFMHDESNSNSISSNLVTDLFEDNAQNLWIGTYQGGINKVDLKELPFTYIKPVKNAFLQSSNEIRSWYVDNMGRSWIGAKDGRIYCYNLEHKKIFTIPDDITNISGFPQKNIYELKGDDQGNLLIGTKGQGFFIIHEILKEKNLKGKYYQISNYQKDYQNDIPDNLNDNNIYSIYQDHLGQIWLGSQSRGVELIEKPLKEMKFKDFVHNANDTSTISNNGVRYIMQDSKHNIWIATLNGLNFLSSKYLKSDKKKFVRFIGSKVDDKVLSKSDFMCVFEDSKGRIWAGTYGGGLKLLHYDTISYGFNFESFQLQNGLPSDVIMDIDEDGDGNLWLATDNGLCKFNYENKLVESYFKEEGLGDNLFSEGTSSRGNLDGKIIFGQKSGWLSFRPQQIKKDSVSFNTHITQLTIWNKEVLPGEAGSPLEKTIEYTEKIKLVHDQNLLGFHFAMLDYSNPENCKYKYKLEGIDNEWVYSGSKRTATYTNLDPGNYTFLVNAANHDGFWSHNYAKLKIEIRPPYYQTWWFRILMLLIIIIAAVTFYITKTRNLKHQKRVLEKLVSQRTSEIKRKNNELLKQAEKLNNTNKLLEERQHFIEEQAEELRAQKEKLEIINSSLNETNTRLEERQQQIEEQSEELSVQAEDLSIKNEELKKLNTTKDKLFSIISHDLKNPFNSILGFCQIIIKKHGTLDSEKVKHLIEIIYGSAKNIYQLLENLLQWSRTQSGTIKISPEKLNVKDIVDENLQLVDNMLKDKYIEVLNNVSHSDYVFADLNMFSTVIRNLLTNAIKFTENGTITITSEKNKQTITIEILDTGVGIPEDKVAKLFVIDKSRSTEGTRGEQGTGLGLIICNEFVQRNDGEIYVKSKEGEGTLFGIVLPLPQ